MTSPHTSYAIALNEAHREVHFSVHGLWSAERMKQFLRELTDAALPYTQWSEPFCVIADMDEFLPQDRETAEVIARHLRCAQGFGLQRLAIVTQSSLIRMQYRRIAGDLDIGFFETKLEALHWSRGFGKRSPEIAA